jgi:hypothetical protein
MSMLAENTALSFLITETLFQIDSVEIVPNLIESNLNIVTTKEKTESIAEESPTSTASDQLDEHAAELELEEEEAIQATRNPIKLLVLTHYAQGAIPAQEQEDFTKLFNYFKLDPSDYKILNVLLEDPEQYQPDYVMLMGGKGKNLSWLKHYSGTRNVHQSVKVGNTKVFFSNAFVGYKENLPEKKALVEGLKEFFS